MHSADGVDFVTYMKKQPRFWQKSHWCGFFLLCMRICWERL